VSAADETIGAVMVAVAQVFAVIDRDAIVHHPQTKNNPALNVNTT
jgi:hypothetical protein